MVIEAGQGCAVERAEAEYHAKFVRLDPVHAAGQPQRCDSQSDQRKPAPAGEASARAAAQQRADIGLQPADQRVEVRQRTRAGPATERSARTAAAPRPAAAGWPLSSAGITTRSPWVRATIVRGH